MQMYHYSAIPPPVGYNHFIVESQLRGVLQCHLILLTYPPQDEQPPTEP